MSSRPIVPLSHLQRRPGGEPDCMVTVDPIPIRLTDEQIALAFCNRGDRNQAVILNRIAEEFRKYPIQKDFIAMVDYDDEALTDEAVHFLETLAESARRSLMERKAGKVQS